jgi:hypothetical protein
MRSNNPLSAFLLLLSLLALGGCRGEALFEPRDAEEGQEYFPFGPGRSWTWQVDSVIYDPVGLNGPVDTVRSWLREAVVDSISGPAGLSYVIHRFTRRDTLLPWVWTRSVLVSPESGRLLWNEDNLTFIKVLHPLYTGMSWQGTAFFDPLIQMPIFGETMQPFKSWSSRILAKGQPVTHHQKHWPDVLEIRHADSENLLERRYCLEQWQRGAGLVYRRMEILDTQCGGIPADCAGQPWALKAEKGYILEQHLIEHH